MSISKIMSMLDENKIKELGELHAIDKVNTKITGEFILKSFVMSALQSRPISLRSIETLSKNDKNLSSCLKAKSDSKKVIDHSSMGKRLQSADVGFFKSLYEDVANKYKEMNPSIDNFQIFDSTIITISNKLMRNGLNLGGGKNDAHIKMSVSLSNSIPNSVRFCSTQSESSEDVALVAAIKEAKVSKEDFLVFDRGISKLETFVEFEKQEQFFVTRINTNRKHKVIKVNEIEPYTDSELTILSDEYVHLYLKKQEIKCPLRIIKAENTNKEKLWFCTNIKDLSAHEITTIYKKRWSIEVLFKFLKQHLQLKKFISYDANGMQIYIYCLLIAAILFMMYKKLNNLSGYKIPMIKFMLDLNRSIVKDIVVFCGGDPNLVDLKL